MKSIFVATLLCALFIGAATAQEQVELDFWTLGASNEQPFYDELFALFKEEHPNIDINLQLFPLDQYLNAVQLAFRGGNEPDILRVGNLGIFNLSSFVAQGWIQPLDRYITPEVTERFPEGFIVEGTVILGNHIYSLPLINPSTAGAPFLYYNKALFAEAGVEAPPTTWDDLRDAARRITEAGNGRFYGYGMMGVQNPGVAATQFAVTSGFVGLADTFVGLNLNTGRFDAAHPAIAKAVEFARTLNLDDRSVLPGWENLTQNTLADAFAQGQVGMAVGPPWWAGALDGRYGLDTSQFGVAPLPTPDGQYVTKFGGGPAQGFFGMTSRTEHPDEVWTFMDFLYSRKAAEIALREGQFGGSPAVVLPSEVVAKLSPTLPLLLEAVDVESVTRPDPAIRFPGWPAVSNNYIEPQPNLVDVQAAAVQGLVNYEEAAAQYNQAADAALDQAIAAAQAEGAAVCRELLVFPNFDGTQDYTTSDYKALPACP